MITKNVKAGEIRQSDADLPYYQNGEFWIINGTLCSTQRRVPTNFVALRSRLVLVLLIYPGGVRTGIAKHHKRYSKSDHLCLDGEEWTSHSKRLWRQIFVKYAVEISDLPLFSSRDVCKNKGYWVVGEKQCHCVNKGISFEITCMQLVNQKIAALFNASVMKVLKVRPVVCQRNDFIVRLVQLELWGTTTISSLLATWIYA